MSFDRLVQAAANGDLAGCRAALEGYIRDQGGELDTKLEAYKAERAENFQATSGGVSFTIERHPGNSWLTHRTQTWFINDASDRFEDAELAQLNLVDLIRESLDASPDGSVAAARGAVSAAVDFADELDRQEGGDLGVWIDQMAHALVVFTLHHVPIAGRWPVRIHDIANRYDRSGESIDRDDARRVNARARELWRLVREGRSGARPQACRAGSVVSSKP